jgi:hypothetical protein
VLVEIADRFSRMAERGYGDEAPTYRMLAEAVSRDAEILTVVAAAPSGRRTPNNLFAAVRFLLLGGAVHPLADAFAAIADRSHDDSGDGADDLVAHFADFVGNHRAEIIDAMAFRSIQTNEPARCAHIAASLAVVQRRHGPLALLDVGTSAGLNLQVDRCHVDYGPVATGPPDSSLRLSCRLLGDGVPPVGDEPPAIRWRHGLDLDPIDLDDEPSRRWLQSCVWIDQRERNERLADAIALARAHPVDVTTGDAIDDLGAVLAMAPPDLHLTVITTWVVSYFDADQRVAFDRALADAGRPISWISLDHPSVIAGIPRPDDTPDDRITPSVLGLVTCDGAGDDRREFLGWAHHHGTWLDWRG